MTGSQFAGPRRAVRCTGTDNNWSVKLPWGFYSRSMSMNNRLVKLEIDLDKIPSRKFLALYERSYFILLYVKSPHLNSCSVFSKMHLKFAILQILNFKL